MIELKSPRINVMIRIRVLHKVVEELVKAFCPDAELETIKKGILDKQYFKSISIYFLNKAGNKVGEVILTIDWDKHHIAANALNGRTFNIDTNQPVNEQLSELFPKIINYTQTIKKHLNVCKTEIWYSWRNEIWSNQEVLKEARQYCGFNVEGSGEAPKWEQLNAKQMEVKIVVNKLNELGLKITHFK